MAIGLSPDFALVAAAGRIYLVDKASGLVKLTRPARKDSTNAVRLSGTQSTLVAVELYSPASGAHYLSHCSLTDCTDAIPPPDSYTFNNIQDFAFDQATSRIYWFDPTTWELNVTSADTWKPKSLGAITSDPSSSPLYPGTVTLGGGKIYGTFEFTIDAVSLDGTSAPVAVSGYPTGEGGSTVTELVTTPDSLVLLYAMSGNMYRVPLPAGIGNLKPDRLQGPTSAVHMATSGSTLFWSGRSTVLTCTLPACSDVQTLATDAAVIQALAVDEAAVYWLSEPNVAGETSLVMRLAR